MLQVHDPALVFGASTLAMSQRSGRADETRRDYGSPAGPRQRVSQPSQKRNAAGLEIHVPAAFYSL